MKIEKNRKVSLSYVLRKGNAEGEIIENVTGDEPLSFLFGGGSLLPEFERNIEGLKVDDKFEFTLKCEDAYGPVNDKAIFDIPKNIFEIDGVIDENLLKVGNWIPLQDQNGNTHNGMVVEIADDTVKMDFNHPMAGDDLHFSGKVEAIREATDEEMHNCCGGSDCSSCDGHHH